jgi:hypothetical protein
MKTDHMPAWRVPKSQFEKIRPTPNLASWILPAALATVVIARCAVESGKRLMWADEFLTWYPVSAPFHSMLAASTDQINSAPPLYFILAWCWTALFGMSALTLRLFSAAAIAAAILVMYAVLRRNFGAFAAAAALAVSLLNPELLYQSSQARFHALVVVEVAIAVVTYQRILETYQPSIRSLMMNAAIHACMVMTDYTGFFYSGAIFCATALSCFLCRKSPVRACLSVFAGWLVFIPWIPTFLKHYQLGKPTFWIPTPNLESLLSTFKGYLQGGFPLFAGGLAAIALVGAVLAIFGGDAASLLRRSLQVLRRREVPLLTVGLAIFSVPVAIYIVSVRPNGISIYLPRYMVPGALGEAILCAYLGHLAFRTRPRSHPVRPRRWLLTFQGIAVCGFVAWVGWTMMNEVRMMVPEARPPDSPPNPGRDPVVEEHINVFLRDHFYAPHPERYYFLVDPDAAIKEGGGWPGTHKNMAALKRNFPGQFKNVVPAVDFLAATKSFWIVRGWIPWYSIRIQNNPAFIVDQSVDGGAFLHVSRRGN